VVINEGPSAGGSRTAPPQDPLLPWGGSSPVASPGTPAAGDIPRPGTADGPARTSLLEQEGIGDEQLVQLLGAFGFDTVLGLKVRTLLGRYALAALASWMSSGLIWEKIAVLTAAKSGRPFRGRSTWSRQEADDLRKDTVAQALLELEDLVTRGWDPALGAGLKTFFTNRCLWIFLNNHKKLLRAKKITFVPLEDAPPTFQPDPQDVVVARETIREALSPLPRQMQMILQLRAEDYTNREIAELVGISEKAVEGRLRRYYERNAPGGLR
jgi:RNA polymerase sigma-70 factor (ECF subfamily)